MTCSASADQICSEENTLAWATVTSGNDGSCSTRCRAALKKRWKQSRRREEEPTNQSASGDIWRKQYDAQKWKPHENPHTSYAVITLDVCVVLNGPMSLQTMKALQGHRSNIVQIQRTCPTLRNKFTVNMVKAERAGEETMPFDGLSDIKLLQSICLSQHLGSLGVIKEKSHMMETSGLVLKVSSCSLKIYMNMVTMFSRGRGVVCIGLCKCSSMWGINLLRMNKDCKLNTDIYTDQPVTSDSHSDRNIDLISCRYSRQRLLSPTCLSRTGN